MSKKPPVDDPNDNLLESVAADTERDPYQKHAELLNILLMGARAGHPKAIAEVRKHMAAFKTALPHLEENAIAQLRGSRAEILGGDPIGKPRGLLEHYATTSEGDLDDEEGDQVRGQYAKDRNMLADFEQSGHLESLRIAMKKYDHLPKAQYMAHGVEEAKRLAASKPQMAPLPTPEGDDQTHVHAMMTLLSNIAGGAPSTPHFDEQDQGLAAGGVPPGLKPEQMVPERPPEQQQYDQYVSAHKTSDMSQALPPGWVRDWSGKPITGPEQQTPGGISILEQTMMDKRREEIERQLRESMKRYETEGN